MLKIPGIFPPLKMDNCYTTYTQSIVKEEAVSAQQQNLYRRDCRAVKDVQSYEWEVWLLLRTRNLTAGVGAY